MECVRTTITLVLNESPIDEFKMKKGLHTMIAVERLNIMLNTIVEVGLFSGYNIGNDNTVFISHLQFADDPLIMEKKSWVNIRASKTNLILFEVILELNVNFNKNMLACLNRGCLRLRWL